MKRIPLVKGREALEGALGHLLALIFAQHDTGKPRSLHVQHLVDQHIPPGSDVGLEASASSQENRLGVSAPVGEFGEVEFDALNALKVHLAQVAVVAQVQGVDTIGVQERGVGERIGGAGQLAAREDVHGKVSVSGGF